MFGSLIAGLLVTWTWHQDPTPVRFRVEALFVVSSDSKLLERLEKQYTLGIRSDVLQDLAKGSRFKWSRWEKDGMILIDSDFGPLKLRKRANEILKGCASAFADGRGKRIRDLPEPMRSAVVEHLKFPMGMRKGGDDPALQDCGIGVSVGFKFSLAGPSRESPITYTVPIRDKAWKESQALLKSAPLERTTANMSTGEKAAFAGDMFEEASRRISYSVRVLGTARDRLAAGMAAAGKEIEKVVDEIDGERSTAIAEFLKRTGMEDPGPSAIGSGELSMADLPPSLRADLEQQIVGSFSAFGFSSADDAKNFLVGATSIRVRTSVSLQGCDRTGGAGPSSFWGYEIGSMPGYPGG